MARPASADYVNACGFAGYARENRLDFLHAPGGRLTQANEGSSVVIQPSCRGVRGVATLGLPGQGQPGDRHHLPRRDRPDLGSPRSRPGTGRFDGHTAAVWGVPIRDSGCVPRPKIQYVCLAATRGPRHRKSRAAGPANPAPCGCGAFGPRPQVRTSRRIRGEVVVFNE